MRKILFVSPSSSGFILQDEEFLKERAKVVSFRFKPGNLFRMILSQTQLPFWLIRNIRHTDLFYIWFADYHSLIPSLFARVLGKKVILVIAGYDVANKPALKYGVHLRPFRSWCARKSYSWATLLLPLSKFLQREVSKWSETPSEVVYPGVNSEYFNPGKEKKVSIVLTVCGCKDLTTYYRKGIDLFIRVAKQCPETMFWVVGLEGKALDKLNESWEEVENLCSASWYDQEVLREFYQASLIYCQFSRYEGAGVALLEAMSCGCIPVVFNRGGMPELVGRDGIVLGTEDPKGIAFTIKDILGDPLTYEYLNPGERVLSSFTLERRHQELDRILTREIG